MKILFLTRKDSKHPFAGGAEKVIHEYAKGLVQLGHQVTWFAYNFPDGKEKDQYDGIEIIRKFSLKTTYFLFPSFYKKHFKGKYDIIIDEAGGLPLLSPLYEKKTPIIFLAHHVGDKERDYNYPWPLSVIGKSIYYQFFKVYKNKLTITVSQSTKEELIQKFGFKEPNINVIENVCDITPLSKLDFGAKEDKILFLGRLMPIKRAEDAIKAFAYFIKSNPIFSHYILDIVGNNQDKKYVQKLKATAEAYDVSKNVNFCWFIERSAFQSFISRHKLMLVPSMKEGFWLIVLEGNSYGLPVIGYDVPGLRDSIQEGVNGYKVGDGDYQAMWKKIIDLLENDDKLYNFSKQALNHVKSLPNRAEQVKKVENVLFTVVAK